MNLNSSITKILYTTRAKKIISFENIDEFWELEDWSDITLALGLSIEHFLNKKLIDYDKFHERITAIEKERLNSFKATLININEYNLIVEVFNYGYARLNAVLHFIGWSVWTLSSKNSMDIKMDILNCFN